MQGRKASEVCRMFEYIMAEVNSPDEYQESLVHHSDHHLPRATPDSQATAQTPAVRIWEG